jgi:AraC-like DNA-binding protein
MPFRSSSMLHSADPEQVRAALAPCGGEYLVTGSGPFAARLTRARLAGWDVVALQEAVPRAWFVVPPPGRAMVLFAAHAEAPVVCQGVALGQDGLAVIRPGGSVWSRLCGPAVTAMLSVPSEMLGDRALRGEDAVSLLLVPPTVLGRLRAMHDGAVHCTEDQAAQLALQGALASALAVTLRHGTALPLAPVRANHARIARLLRDLPERPAGEPMAVAEACAALRITQRTLHACCAEQIGVGPKRYLMLRRLHLAHRALREAAAGTRVTEIATRYGFWELGRFAMTYRGVFGQLPSTTIRTA